jgi:hypothetical protein
MENIKQRNHLVDICVDGRVILKWILEETKCGVDLIGSG